MRLLTKIILVVLAAVAFSYLGGCAKKPAVQEYGFYNLGLCSPNQDFMESTVDVEADTFTIIAYSDGPDSIEKRDPPLVLKYVGDSQDGLRRYTVQLDGHEDEVAVSVKGGELVGRFSVGGKVQARLHGHKGTLETEGQDGEAEYERSCKGAN